MTGGFFPGGGLNHLATAIVALAFVCVCVLVKRYFRLRDRSFSTATLGLKGTRNVQSMSNPKRLSEAKKIKKKE